MTQILRQSTQIVVRVGPFVDVGDGFTPETGIDLSTADEAELLKANTTTTTSISGATWAAITGCDGWYGLTLTTSLTDTVGPLDVMVNDDSVCLPVFARFQVIEEAVYDMLYAASALGYVANAPVNVAQISADSTAADNLEAAYDDAAGSVHNHGIIDQGTAQSIPDTTHTQIRAASAFETNVLAGATLYIVSATTGAGQRVIITSNVTATDTVAHDAFPVALTGTVVYKIFATPPSSSTLLPKVDVDTIKTNPVVNGGTITFPTGATLASTTNITGGTITTVTTTTNLTNAPSDSSGVTTLLSRIGGTITISGGAVNADVKKINAVTIGGSGVAGDEFEP